jgi:hypothetical protein
MRWLALLLLAVGCTGSSDSCPSSPPESGPCATDGLQCTYPGAKRPTIYTCESGSWRSNDCTSMTCDPGDTCSFSDWERDCDCGCTAEGTWSCTPLYDNYACPFQGYPDAGVIEDAPTVLPDAAVIDDAPLLD